MTEQAIFRYLVSRLAAVRKKENAVSLIRGTVFSALLVSVVTLVFIALEAALYLGVLPRTIFFFTFAFGAAGLLGWSVLRPLLQLLHLLPNESDVATARKVGAKFPGINDHLVNILQLHKERGSHLYSPELVDASFDDVRKEIEPLDFTSIVDAARTRRLGVWLTSTLAAALLFVVVFPSTFVGSAQRLLHYRQSFETPPPFRFLVSPGNKEVIKGATIGITVRVEGEPQKRITFSSKPAGQIAFDDRILLPGSDGSFTYEFSSLASTTQYKVSAGPVESEHYSLTVLDRPAVNMLRLHLAFPSYTKLPSRTLEDNIGDVSALRGTRVTFSIESNKELADALIAFSDSTSLGLAVTDKKATGGLTLKKDRTYHVVLRDRKGVASTEPIEYAMKALPDAYPTAAILFPGTSIDIAENQRLNILCKITDDYGFTSLRLAYRLVHSRYEKPSEEYAFAQVPLPPGITTEGEVAYLWSLARLNLVPEDVVSYYIEVFDNDNVSGPKSARSETYTLRLPSLEEVFAEVSKGHDVSLEQMKESLKQAQEAKKGLEELQQDMKKNRQKMDWQQQKQTEEMLKKYQEIQKKLDEVNKSIDAMVDQMQKNQLISKETLEKYQELQHLMEQMNSPEFNEAMKKLQQAMQQMNPEMMKQALQNFQFSEENFRKSIERTMNLLKRIQIEQKVDEALKRTEEMLRQQRELEKETRQANSSDKSRMEELARQQEDLRKQLEQLQKELAELQKKMEEFPAEMPLSEMQQARDELEQSQPEADMERAAQQLQQQQTPPAMQSQRNAMQKMGQFMQQLQQMKQAMQQNQQRQIVNEMRRALQDLLGLSQREEALKKESQGLEQNSQRFRDNAQQQMEVLRDLATVTNALAKLSQKTFAVTPEMGKSIGDAMRQMNQAMQALEQRNGSAAGSQQEGAMSSLNEAAQRVQSAMNAMMQGSGSGMGMGGLMQRMQQLTGQQQGINQGTQQMGGMGQQQAAEMARLAGEQGAVRKSLEQLAKEAANAGELSKMLGDLNRIAQDMREVQTDLAQGNVNPETLRKQDRILSRLLDSQRSMHERDFEKRRKAETGADVARRSPRDIDLTTQEGRTRLQKDMQKALEEGYAKDYEELIRKYFEALEKLEKNN